MCRLRRVIAPSSLSDRHPHGSACTARPSPEFHPAYLVRRRTACPTSNEALHTLFLPLSRSLSPRSPAQTAEGGKSSGLYTSPLCESNLPAHRTRIAPPPPGR